MNFFALAGSNFSGGGGGSRVFVFRPKFNDFLSLIHTITHTTLGD